MERKTTVTLMVLLLLPGIARAEAEAKVWAKRLAADPIAASVRLAGLEDRALPILPALLDHEDAAVRRGAVLTAGRLGDRALEISKRLIAALDDPAPAVRAAAAWAIGHVAWYELPPRLLAMLGDESEAVRVAAAAFLEEHGSKFGEDLFDIAESGKEPAATIAWRILAAADGDVSYVADSVAGAPDDLIEAVLMDDSIDPDPVWVQGLVDHANVGIRFAAIRRLGDHEAATKALVKALSDPDSSIRHLAVLRLPSTEEVRPLLTKALRDPEAAVRWQAARRLVAIGKSEAIRALADLFADPDSAVAASASDELGKLGEAAMPVLVEQLGSPDPRRRRLALQAMSGMFDEPEAAREQIVARLGDPDLLVRVEAANALCTATGEIEKAVPILVQALTTGDPQIRVHVCRRIAAANWKILDWRDYLKKGLPLARALIDLHRFGEGEIVTASLKALEESHLDDVPEIETEYRAQMLLEAIRRGRRIESPGQRSGVDLHEDPWAAIRALVRLEYRSPEFLDLLDGIVKGDDTLLADWARWAKRELGVVAAPTIEDLVGQLAAEDPYVRWRAVKDLARRREAARPAVLKLKALLEDENPFVRVAAAAAIAEFGGKR